MLGLGDILKLIGLIVNLVAWAKLQHGVDWDQALLSAGKATVLLANAKTEEERNAALEALHRGFNPGGS